MVKFSPSPSMVTSSLLSVVCVPASCSGVSRPGMTWWVSTAVSWRVVGQQRVERVGRDRLEGRVGRGQHGDVVGGVQRVAQVRGGDGLDQRGQRRVVAGGGGDRVVGHPGEAALALGGDGRAAGAERLVRHRLPRWARSGSDRAAAGARRTRCCSAASSEPQALSVMARVEAAVMRTPRVRRLLFTGWCSLSCPCDGIVAGGSCAGRGRGPESRRRRVPGRVWAARRAGGWSCRRAPGWSASRWSRPGTGAARASVCTSPSALVARTVIECRPAGKS